ncbi:hypothetical protein ACFWGN_16165 [Oerskovia sp. NPDC060338]|uniref:hypothetical protein n=1 Tax=Oerskovia sp. NPDC060338 TaxID=3347100 RepID=UPI003652D40B
MYRSIGAASSRVKAALHEQITAALAAADETEVDIAFGFRWPAQYPDEVAVTAVRATDVGEGTVSPERRRQVLVSVDVSIVSFRVTDDERVPHERAYGLLDVIDAHLREGPTLGGAALWCMSDDLASDGATHEEESEEGRICEVSVTFAARVIVTR